jgi:serine/threonine protein phosphatase PrpC
MQELDFAFYSDEGGRLNNEDAFLAKKMPHGYLFVVADGLGGHDDGEIASYSAVNSIKEYMTNKDSENILEAVCFANEVVLDKQTKHSSKMKTTIALAYVSEEKTIVAHVGDSRVYAFKDNKVVHQTIDHSASQLAVMVGEIKAEEIRSHSDRNILLRALGAGDNIKVEISEIKNSEYDALLLCSDGFWEYVLESEMENELSSSKAADKWLYKMRSIQLSRSPKRCDNNTAIAVMK